METSSLVWKKHLKIPNRWESNPSRFVVQESSDRKLWFLSDEKTKGIWVCKDRKEAFDLAKILL